MTPEEYIKIKAVYVETRNKVREFLDSLYEEMEDYMPPKEELRKATPKDVVVGAVFYYPPEDQEDPGFWQIIEDVLYPDDDWKAYCGADGCRYGLDNAYVKKDI